jgi:hypothetical protein
MKKLILLVLFVFGAITHLLAQTEPVKTPETKKALTPVLLVTAGYVPKTEYQALKTSVAFNNIVLDRFGTYISFEKGADSGYFSNIYGITGTITKDICLWGGVDLFTRHGLLTHNNSRAKGIRKEFGISVIPVKPLVVKAGWSFGAGMTLEAGIRIPL